MVDKEVTFTFEKAKFQMSLLS